MRASTSRFARDFSRPYFEARWVTRSFLFLSDDRSSSENLPHLARISLMTICLVSAAEGACPALKFAPKDTLDGESSSTHLQMTGQFASGRLFNPLDAVNVGVANPELQRRPRTGRRRLVSIDRSGGDRGDKRSRDDSVYDWSWNFPLPPPQPPPRPPQPGPQKPAPQQLPRPL